MKHLSKLEALRQQLKPAPDPIKRGDPGIGQHPVDTEADLFSHAMQDVIPLAPLNKTLTPAMYPPAVAIQRIKDEKAALSESLSDAFDVESLLETDDRLSWRRDGIGPDVVRKLRRGHWVLQDELDLHGATREVARELLSAFVH